MTTNNIQAVVDRPFHANYLQKQGFDSDFKSNNKYCRHKKQPIADRFRLSAFEIEEIERITKMI